MGQGVTKVVCGSYHALAMTLTGHVFGWGENTHGQACPEYNLSVCSMPKLISLPTGTVPCRLNRLFCLLWSDLGLL